MSAAIITDKVQLELDLELELHDTLFLPLDQEIEELIVTQRLRYDTLVSMWFAS